MMTFYELRQRVLSAPMTCSTRGEIWHRYLSGITSGQALEFGVWNGRSINYMAEVRPKAAFTGFDSFEGLPEEWIKGHPAGHFKTDISKVRWRPNVCVKAGWFNDTLPAFVPNARATMRKLQGVHIDCDLGSSTATVLRELADWVKDDKPLLLFDEFYNYAGYEDHEFKAFLEWVNEHQVAFQIIARNTAHQQVLIELV